ncbi:flavodoxin [Paenibacillus sedimenti]|uniref:Flavodoxin n=1 Tax=Paenibacillus sedimenti TaxID=2770274 RepID=A0A926QHJ0_9BACL|nr:flavodoxin [Paenibacillus sedimenti]MBD0379555.1 flavodoxin [Paenibacillus sedimenti]
MSKIIIVFASMTGNTEEIAEAIAEGIREAGIEPVVKSVMDANGQELENYDGILLGAYTWGDGDLPDEFEDFYEEMDDLNLQGRKSAVFGSADSSYAQFGAAVDTLEAKLAELGAEKVLDGLKIELNPSKEEKQFCLEYGKKFAAALGVTN